MKQLDVVEQQVLELIKKEKGRPIPAGVLVRLMNEAHNFKNKQKIYGAIESLIASGLVRQLAKNNKLVLGYEDADVLVDQAAEGILQIGARNCGFIKLINQDRASYFVHPLNLNGAINGDTVKFAPLDKPARDLKDAKVLEVISHSKVNYVGKYTFNGNENVVYPDDPKLYLTITLDKDYKLNEGDKILFKIEKVSSDNKATASLIKVIGNERELGVNIKSIVYDNGVNPDFNPKALEQAKLLKLELDDKQKKLRKDLTDLDIVTIDPATSKDLDDAIYVEKLANGNYRLVVAIADVSHYIPLNSDLDLDALSRASSIYLVNKVIPMLPEILSNELCSINPGQDRMALVSDVEINAQGEIVKNEAYPAVINSKRRYSYDEVNGWFNKTNKLENDSDSIKSMLDQARDLAVILRTMKHKRGYIEFELPEPYIVLDENNIPIDILLKKHEEAQSMIEDFMVCANEAIAKIALNNKLPFIYRVHPKPSARKMTTFSSEAKRLDFKISENFLDLKYNTISKWLEDNKDNKNLSIINRLLLRSMAKAFYSVDNIFHFGLASRNYTHFTSPIRRYPDLIVHRILWMFIFDKESYSDNDRDILKNKLKEICEQSNFGEIRATDCERAVNNYMFCVYMSHHIGDQYEGFISSVTNYGMFVELPNTIDGLIRVINMNDDFYSFNEATSSLVGRQTGKTYALGDRVKIKVENADIHARKIDFSLVN